MTSSKRHSKSGGRRPTRDDVAARAGVSSAVVSYVLNEGPRPVAEETRERVLEAVRELDYLPNEIARSLAGQSTRSVGLITPTLANPVWAEVTMGVTDVLSEASYLPLVCDVEDVADQEAKYAAMLVAKRVDGAVLVPTADTEATVRILHSGGVSVVVVEQEISAAPCVVVDPEATGRMVTDHLLSLGHTRIGFLREHRTSLDSWRRYDGYESALTAAGVAVDPLLVVDAPASVDGSIVAGGIEAARALLDADIRPTAVFAHNDLMAIAVIHEARRRGLQVPKDVSVVGIDDLEVGRYMDPPLTTLPFPKRELGRVAARKLLALMEGTVPEQLTTLPPPELIIRESTARPPS